MKLSRVIILGATLALASCVTACAGDSDDVRPTVTVKELSEGLTLFNATGKLTGAYRKGDRAIFFETNKGALRPEIYRKFEPELGDYEMDVLVLDEDGRVVYLQQGGDNLDERWERALERESTLAPVAPVRRAETMELIKEWSASFEKVSVPADLSFHKRSVVDTKLAVRDDMLRPAVEKATKEVGYAPASGWIEIHDKSIYLVGRHSAHYSNKNGYIVNACNHGSCASTMGLKCSSYTTAKVQYASSNCSTHYDWNSNGGGHNCHDDTVRALWGMKSGSQGDGTTGVCANSAGHTSSPDCTTTSW